MRKQSGITLIALIITIIVMLILVGVTVNIVINGGLFETAGKAKSATEKEVEKEQLIDISIGSFDNTGKFNKENFKSVIATKTGYQFEETTGKITTPTGNIFFIDEYGNIVDEAPIVPWDGLTKTEVAESENNTYYISNAAELAWIAEEVNGGNSFSGKTIILTKDIDLGNQEWLPIGRSTATGDIFTFEGTFNGNGHVVSNFKFTLANEAATDYVIGFFGAVNGATIQKLGIENVTIDENNSWTQRGGIVGATIGNTTISECYSKNVTMTNGFNYGAGIVSVCYGGELTIENCYNTSGYEYTNSFHFSGILAQSLAGTTVNIDNCYNIGSSNADFEPAGSGIYATAEGTITLNNCYSIDSVNREITGLTVKTLEEMKGIASELGNAFKNDPNGGYPILVWQN